MKFPCLFVLAASLALAESHPSWWTYASPEATALVGIQWDNLRNSPLASAVDAELFGAGPLGFPDLECLKHARELIISAPELLAAAAGSFPSAAVKDQAPRAGLHRLVYRGVTLWIPDAPTALGVAEISEQLVLVGERKTLQTAVDRSLLESARPYSGLLPRAARFSQTGDLWVVALKLPDPLASLFVPLDAQGYEFAGELSIRGGLSVDASFDASSTDAAETIAAQIQEQAQTLPSFARALEATSDRRTVNIELQASTEDVLAALHGAPGLASQPAPAPTSTPAPAAPVVAKAAPLARAPQATAAPQAILPNPLPQAAVSQPAGSAPAVQPKPAPPPQPQVIHITGLDDGPREIVLPPLPASGH